jgi:putative restriction endonuclease
MSTLPHETPVAPELNRYGKEWSRDELVLALFLYFQVPIQIARASNPDVERLARLIGRTPASVTLKLGNFGALDPQLAAEGIEGMANFSQADRRVWLEFDGKWAKLAQEGEHLLAERSATAILDADRTQIGVEHQPEPVIMPASPSERPAIIDVRVVQSFFRRTILASYEWACCICGLNLTKLLVASHIKAWKDADDTERADPHNGLCLCAIHDRAFDAGFLSVSKDLSVMISGSILRSKQPFIEASLAAFNGIHLHSPNRFPPRGDFLMWHRENVFSRD